MGTSFNYRGFTIIRARHPTALNPARETWDIMDDDKLLKTNIASAETAKHVVDIMIQYYYLHDKRREK